MPKPKFILTSRELEVLSLIAQGQTAQQIGDILRITARTATAHTLSIVRKFGANNRTHAVTLAIRDGLLKLD